jgi:hypothetical protein
MGFAALKTFERAAFRHPVAFLVQILYTARLSAGLRFGGEPV